MDMISRCQSKRLDNQRCQLPDDSEDKENRGPLTANSISRESSDSGLATPPITNKQGGKYSITLIFIHMDVF